MQYISCEWNQNCYSTDTIAFRIEALGALGELSESEQMTKGWIFYRIKFDRAIILANTFAILTQIMKDRKDREVICIVGQE